MAKQDITIKNI